MKHPRIVGHRGILAEVYVFDGLLHNTMLKYIKGRHHLMYSEEYGNEMRGSSNHSLLYLMNWVEGFPCAAHCVSNGIKWSLQPFGFETCLEDWHIVFESLRNSSCDLVEMIPHFVAFHVRYRGQVSTDSDAAFGFWEAFMPPYASAATIRKFLPLFLDGILWIEYDCQFDLHAMRTLCYLLSTCLRWSKFCSTRWGGIRKCSGQYVVSEALGISKLSEMLRKRTNASSGHVNGYFEKMSPGLKRFIGISSLSARPGEKFVLSLLEDDRLLRQFPMYVEDCNQEVRKVCRLPAGIFTTLALVLGYDACEGVALQQDTIRATLACRSFIDRGVFEHCRELPFCLAIGNIGDNLKTFLESPGMPSNLTAQKIKALNDLGIDPTVLATGVALWLDASLTTHNIEKGHKVAAVMLEAASSGMGMPRLVSQGFLNSIRIQFEKTSLELSMELLQKQMTFLEQRNPNRLRANNMLLRLPEGRAMLALTQPRQGGAVISASTELSRHKVARIIPLWSSAPGVVKDACEAEADIVRKRKVETIRDEKASLRRCMDECSDAIEVSKRSVSADVGNHVGSHRFGQKDCVDIWSAYRRGQIARTKRGFVGAECTVSAPSAPDNDFSDLLLETAMQFEVAKQPPWWVRELCPHRDDMHRVVLWQTDPPADGCAFLWMYGLKSPHVCQFLRLRRLEWENAVDVAAFFRHSSRWYDHVYTWEPMQFLPESKVPLNADADYAVLQDIVFLPPSYVTSNLEARPFHEFILTMPNITKARDPGEGGPRLRRTTAAPVTSLFEEFPWLAQHFAERKRPVRRPVMNAMADIDESEGPSEEDEAPVAAIADDDEAEAVPLLEDDDDDDDDGGDDRTLADVRLQLDPSDRTGAFYVQWLGGLGPRPTPAVISIASLCLLEGTAQRLFAFCLIGRNFAVMRS
jgi:hypothetical protein